MKDCIPPFGFKGFGKIKKGGILLKCGAKCFLVEIETDGQREIKTVRARTPVAARKVIRREFGEETQIITVKAE